MPMSLLLIVAATQGLTEFLPISSSGHLALIPVALSYEYQGKIIDVAAHVGTLLAVTYYMRKEVVAISLALVSLNNADTEKAKLGLLLIVATLPVIGVGYFVNYANFFWMDLVLCLALVNIFFALILWIADKTPALNSKIETMRFGHATVIGLAQIFALLPGASRSGVTISAARFLGYDRVSATRFSLLLSLPVIAGAGILKTRDLFIADEIELGIDAILVVVFSAFFAWIAIHWMIKWVEKVDFKIFVYYRIILGVFLLLAVGYDYIEPTYR